ncbi:hypothetical protein OG943_16895 [Amycolatopsis sp. NBC_00345]|uniref:hypothetical protein n=1 Tax=Amycolatopsis sp. NBC_00345 TaxID=2975955 RepID=UPI002E25A3E5
MKFSLRTYTAYSIACAVVWAAILIVVATVRPQSLHMFVIVFFGWAIGWLSATVARSVYPPPRQRGQQAQSS